MARAVPPWLHRILIRDRGPADPWIKLVLYTINATMKDPDAETGDDGAGYWAQETIARAACMGVSTVRRKIAEASKLQWIALETRAALAGRKWKQYRYRACCPDSIDLAAIPIKKGGGAVGGTAEGLVDHWESVWGGIADSSVAGTMFPQLGKSRRVAPPAPGGRKVVAAPPTAGGSTPDKHDAKRAAPPAHATSTARSSTKDRPLTTEAPPAAAYEVPILSTNVKPQDEGAASQPAMGGSTSDGTEGRKAPRVICPPKVISPILAENDPEVQRKRSQAALLAVGAKS
jgi:hypothetical protein